MIKGFLLDIDGTLLDSNEAHVMTWQHAITKFGYDVTKDEIRSLIGMGGDRLLTTLIPELHAESGKGKQIADYRKKCITECLSETLKPTSGARELLVALRARNIRLVVATSSSKEEAQILLRCADIEDLIEESVNGSDVAHSKPSPDIITLALEKAKLSPDKVLMLGDSPYDIASAKKEGVKTIALKTGGFSNTQLKGAAYIFQDPKDVLRHLDEVLHINELHKFQPHLM